MQFFTKTEHLALLIKLTNVKYVEKFSLIWIWGTPVFPPGLTNLKRNPGENPGVGSIPLKSNDFQTAKTTVKLLDKKNEKEQIRTSW